MNPIVIQTISSTILLVSIFFIVLILKRTEKKSPWIILLFLSTALGAFNFIRIFSPEMAFFIQSAGWYTDILSLALSICILAVSTYSHPVLNAIRNSEIALQESNEKFRALAETTGTAIFVYRDTFLYLNPAAYEISEYGPEDIGTVQFWKIAAPEFQEMIRSRASSRLSGGTEPERYEIRIITKSGASKWLDLSVGIINYDGKPAGLATAADITQRKMAEDRIHSSEQELSSIFENLVDIFYRTDANGIITRVSPSVKQILGYEPSELLGSSISSMYVELDGRNKYLEALSQADGSIKNYEAPVWRKDGSICWVSSHSHYIYDNDGICIGVEGLTRDITEKKKTEEALRQSEERFSKAFHSSPAMALISKVSDGEILDVSESFLSTTGYQREDLIGKSVIDIGLWVEPERRNDILNIVSNKGFVVDFEMRLKTRNNDIRHCLISMQIINIDNEKCLVTGGIDITERKNEDIVRRSREQRMRSQQVALLSLAKHESIHQGDLTSTISSITETSALTLNTGHAGVWMFDDSNMKLVCIDKYNQITGQHSHGEYIDKNAFPVYFDTVEHNLVISVDDVYSDSRTSELAKQYLPSNNISSLLDAPVRIDGKTIGVVCHEHVGDIRSWTLDEQNFAASIAEMVALAIDQQKRKNTESELYAEKERAHVTLESIGDGVVTTNIDGVIEYCNPVAEHLSGWSKESMLGQHILKVFNITDENTGYTVRDPISRCLRENKCIILPENSLLNHRDGINKYFVEVTVSSLKNNNNEVIGVTLVFHDTTELRAMSRMMSHQATHDELTSLINRREFESRLRKAIKSSVEDGKNHTMCYLDLDQFKLVNDTCGHSAGDELLRQLSHQFQDKIRETDTLARLGGDEFGILLNDCPIEKAKGIAETLRLVAKNFRFLWEGKIFEVGVSIGLAEITPASGSIANVMKSADSACYLAKENGRNRIHLYEVNDAALLQRRGEMQWIQDIQRAFKEDRLELYMQPILSLKKENEGEKHCELLLRLSDADDNIILPDIFLPAAEKYHLMPDIDRWVVKSAFTEIYNDNLLLNDASICAINISGQSLGNEDFHTYIIDLFSKYKISPEKICFEITETSVISNLSRATKFIAVMKDMGCSFSLDDFGSGLSSFAYLKNLRVDYLKIDGSFVKDMLMNKNDHSMVTAINQIGKLMGIKTIAECVEDEETMSILSSLGVDYAQGSAISRPVPISKSTVSFSSLIESLSTD